MFAEAVSSMLDPKPLAVGIFVLTLYVTTTIAQYKILDKLEILLNNQGKQKDDADDVEIERVKAVGSLDGLIKTSEEIERKLDDVVRYFSEKRVIVDNIQAELHEVSKQQTVLATAQLNQSQSTNRVIDGLLEALSEHSKE
jgi:hypothetical protein